MKQTTIPRQADKPKRGTQYFWTEKGIDVWLERIISNHDFLVCDSEERGLEDAYFNVNPDELLQPKKAGFGIVAKPKVLTKPEKEFKQELNVFYASEALRIPDRCENCNQPLRPKNVFERRAIVAHILPKSPNSGFPTIAIHPQNKMFLGTYCGCHNKWDNTDGETRATMPCYSIAIERFKTYLAPRLTDKEYVKACTYLNISWQ